MSKTKNVYETEIGSPPDYEELVAYVYYGNSFGDVLYNNVEMPRNFTRHDVAILTKEEGPDKVKIKFSEYVTQNNLNVDELIEAIKVAKEELLK
jgi:hypothetical protein